MRKFILKAPSKSCALDPLPTPILKKCLDLLLPIISRIINNSLSTGSFPDEFKLALVTPLLKKLGLELVFPSFRPVSNLSFISKLSERVVADQFIQYCMDNGLYEPFQSAYTKHRSTETALLRIHNDILQSMDKQCVSLLVLLDLSAAFDTVDHHVLLTILERKYGVTGTVLDWFRSYLSGRTQCVSIDGVKSDPQSLKYGVPQGSVLGPILFSVYTSSLGDIIRKHGINYHLYADDTQLYLSFKPGRTGDQQEAVSKMEACILDIRSWMKQNKLKLNEDKTVFMLIGGKKQMEKVNFDSIAVGDAQIKACASTKNLGAGFDSHLTMMHHVNSLCKSGFYHLRNIARIKNSLTRSALETIVHALVTSRIDYCNSLLGGAPDCVVKKLQSLQNSASRLVTGTKKFDHISPILADLHWLKVKYRIEFKILLLTFKCMNRLVPEYLSELIIEREPTLHRLSSGKLCHEES